MSKRIRYRDFLLVMLATTLLGCSSMGPTTFVHQGFDFGYVERVAVIPFENLTQDQGAGYRATRFFVAELLAAEAFDIVEPGEISRVLQDYNLVRTGELSREQATAIGKKLGAQAIIVGSVGESSEQRRGSGTAFSVTLIVRMLETDTGSTVWSTTHTAGGRGFMATLFGTSDRSESEVMRQCVEESVKTLIQ